MVLIAPLHSSETQRPSSQDRVFKDHMRDTIGRDRTVSIRGAAAKFGVGEGFVRYARAKTDDPTLHDGRPSMHSKPAHNRTGERGGPRNNLFTPAEHLLVETILWKSMKEEPLRTD